jgi:hypothetical protein
MKIQTQGVRKMKQKEELYKPKYFLPFDDTVEIHSTQLKLIDLFINLLINNKWEDTKDFQLVLEESEEFGNIFNIHYREREKDRIDYIIALPFGQTSYVVIKVIPNYETNIAKYWCEESITKKLINVWNNEWNDDDDNILDYVWFYPDEHEDEDESKK